MKASLRQTVLCLQASIDPNLPGLVLEVAFHVITDLPTRELVSRIEKVAERHAVLRQRFVMRKGSYWIEQARAQQRRYCLVRTCEEASAEALLASNREPIRVESERLFHAEVVEQRDGQRYLVFRIHHAIADLWSIGLLIRDFAEGCKDRSSVTRVPTQTAPVIDREFWRQQMSQDASFSLPVASQVARTNRCKPLSSFVIDQESTAALSRLARACATTSYTVLLAAQVLALSRLGQSHRLSLAVTFHGRNRSNKDAVGYFANTLAVPFDVSECTVTDFIKRTARRLAEASKASVGAGHPELAEYMAGEGQAPSPPSNAVIFQQNMPGMPRGLAAALLGLGTVQLGEMALTAVEPPPSIGPFATALLLTRHDDKLHGRVEIDPGQHPAWLADAIATQFATILQKMVRDPQVRLSALPACLLPPPADQGQARPGPASETMVAAFLRQVAIDPDKPALLVPQTTVSYGELASQVGKLSAAIRLRGFKPGQSLAILLPRDIHLVPTLLAVMACGGSYVPLSEANSVALNRSILAQARCQAILTDQKGVTRFAHLAPCWSLSDLLAMADAQLQDQSRLHDKAYILFTSGSTGQPKGVAKP